MKPGFKIQEKKKINNFFIFSETIIILTCGVVDLPIERNSIITDVQLYLVLKLFLEQVTKKLDY